MSRLDHVSAELRALVGELERILDEALEELNRYLAENGAGVRRIIA